MKKEEATETGEGVVHAASTAAGAIFGDIREGAAIGVAGEMAEQISDKTLDMLDEAGGGVVVAFLRSNSTLRVGYDLLVLWALTAISIAVPGIPHGDKARRVISYAARGVAAKAMRPLVAKLLPVFKKAAALADEIPDEGKE